MINWIFSDDSVTFELYTDRKLRFTYTYPDGGPYSAVLALEAAVAEGVDLSGADLSDADLTDVDIWDANFLGANVTGVKGLDEYKPA